tara:strand:+ start:29920 stop:30606 length:687 start_codon:yes stop_codon:yes gene_type:complete
MSFDLQPAYVLHSRPYRDSSALVDLLTLREGMQRVVWRGAKRGKGIKPQPFTPLLLSLYGRGDLKTLRQAEVAGGHVRLQGEALFSGLYLNELLVRLLSGGDPQTLLFAAYQTALEQLAAERAVEPVLREFEWQLLSLLGYGFSLQTDALGEPLSCAALYLWDAEQGLQRTESQKPGLLPGAGLLAMSSGDWQHPAALHTAKRLMRKALAVHLGDRPLMSRQLFAAKP